MGKIVYFRPKKRRIGSSIARSQVKPSSPVLNGFLVHPFRVAERQNTYSRPEMVAADLPRPRGTTDASETNFTVRAASRRCRPGRRLRAVAVATRAVEPRTGRDPRKRRQSA